MSNETVISSANARIKAMHRFRGQDPTNYSTPVKKRWDAKFGLAGLGNELALNADLDSVGRRVRVKNTSGGALGKGSLVAVAGAKLTAQTTGTASNSPVAGTSVTITIAGTWEAGQLVRVESGGYTDYCYISSIGSGFIVVDILMYAHTTPVVTAEPAYEITLADADGSNAAEWVLPADIADGAYGYAYDCCEVSGLDTSALTAEALVYLSATAGGYTATAPTGSDQIQQVVGVVKSSHASTGSILFIPGLKRILKLGSSCLQSGVGGGVSDGDKGDVTVSSSGTVWTIDNGVVTFAKMANMTTDRLVGRDTAGSGAPEEISVGGGVEFTGSGGIQRSALTGDVTATAGSNTTTISNSAVTFAKFQDISTDKLLGRDTASSGVVEEIGLTGGLEFDGAGNIRIADAGITTTKVVDANITFAKIQSASAASLLLGRGSAALGGVFQEITLGAGLTMSGTILSGSGLGDGDKGDVTVTGGGAVWTIDNGVVTTAKIADSNVTTAKIADSNVTTAKIADANVTYAKFDSAAITSLQRKNVARNPAFNVWQRGTSAVGTTDNSYGADGWRTLLESANAAYQSRSTDAPTGFKYSNQIDVGISVDKKFGIFQPIEGIDIYHLRGQTATFSVYLKVSNATNLSHIRMGLCQWTSTEDAVSADPVSSWGTEGNTPTLTTWTFLNTPANLSVTTSWVRYSVSGSVSASATNLGLFVWNEDRSSTSGSLYVAGTQLESGATATPFEFCDVQKDLARCQRYFAKTYDTGTAPATNTFVGSLGVNAPATGVGYFWVNWLFKVEMRSVPVVTVYSPNSSTAAKCYSSFGAGADVDATAIFPGTSGVQIYNTAALPGVSTTYVHAKAEADL